VSSSEAKQHQGDDMKRLCLVLTLIAALALAASAQTSNSAQGAGSAQASTGAQTSASSADINNSAQLAAGTTIAATLVKPLDAKKAKQGDEVTAKAAQNVVSNGSVVIPRGTKLVGHVTDAKPKAKGESQSSLGIAFDKAVLKNGQEMPLQATIRAISAAERSNTSSDLGPLGVDNSGIHSPDMSSNTPQSSGGPVGGVTSTAGAAAGTAAGAAGNTVGGAVNSTVNTAGHAGGAAVNTTLNSASQGVVGLEGLSLSSQTSNGSVISSTTKNVRLDSGTQLLLQVTK
jgi:hypothetical protein